MKLRRCAVIETSLDLNVWQFDIDVPRFLTEVIDNSGSTMYRAAWSVFIRLLREVAIRATELHDPVMDILMLRMNLYDVPINERVAVIESLKSQITCSGSPSSYPPPIP